MIAVQTNEYLYVIEMSIPEFLENVAKDGLHSSAIHAKTIANINQNRWLHLANAVIPEITCCFRQIGDQFVIDTKPINSSKDLEFFIAPDGSQYSCESAYLLEAAKGEKANQTEIVAPVVEGAPINSGQEAGIPNPVLGDKDKKDIPNPVGEGAPNPVLEGSSTHGQNVIELPASLEDDFYKPTGLVPFVPPQLEQDEPHVVEVSENQKRAAGQLDNAIRNLPHLSSIPSEFLNGVINYVMAERDKMKGYAEAYLRSSSRLDRGDLETDFPVPNALGSSYDMIDSLLAFPVYTRVISKKDLAARFSPMDLVNSTMLRVCPIGIEGDRVHSYVQSIKITNQDVKDAEELLKKEGKSKKKLSPKEKYERMEAALEQVFKNKKGSLAASRETQLVGDLGQYFDELVSNKKAYIPAMEEWQSYDVVALDAREKVEQFPTPLLQQLQSINGKTFEELGIVEGSAFESPFEEELDSPEEALDVPEETAQLRVVRINQVDSDAKDDNLGYIEVSENFLSATERDSIVALDGGIYVLQGYFYDMASGNVITDIEYEEIIQNNASKEEPPIEVSPMNNQGENLGPVLTQPEIDTIVESFYQNNQPKQESGIPNPVTQNGIPDRRFRPPIIVTIPTEFSLGYTPEKAAAIPDYREFVTLSEDDMTDALKSCIGKTDSGYELIGYCYDYDQRLISEFLSISTQAAMDKQEKFTMGPLDGLSVQNVSMGGAPLGELGTAPIQPQEGEKTDGEPLVDYVRPDGKYIDPNGEEWNSKDEWALYMMLSDDNFLTGEEEKGKQF